MDFEVNVNLLSKKRAVLQVKGRLTAVTAPVLKARFKELVDAGQPELVCDLSQVGFLDSSGLSALVSGLKATRESNGWLKLAGLNEQVRTIFKLTMLDRVFEMYPNVEGALASA